MIPNNNGPPGQRPHLDLLVGLNQGSYVLVLPYGEGITCRVSAVQALHLH